MQWHTSQGLEGAESSSKDSQITCLLLNNTKLAVGDYKGQLVVFDLKEDQLVFNCEITAFDHNFEITRGC